MLATPQRISASPIDTTLPVPLRQSQSEAMLRRGSSQIRKGRFSESSRIYFLTAVTYNRRPVFVEFIAGRILVRELHEEDARGELQSLAFVVMPDHLHWLVQLRESGDLSRCMQRMKSRSARAINAHLSRTGRFWQDGFHDHALRKEEDVIHFARYVVANPLRAGLVRSIRNYPLWDAIWI